MDYYRWLKDINRLAVVLGFMLPVAVAGGVNPYIPSPTAQALILGTIPFFALAMADALFLPLYKRFLRIVDIGDHYLRISDMSELEVFRVQVLKAIKSLRVILYILFFLLTLPFLYGLVNDSFLVFIGYKAGQYHEFLLVLGLMSVLSGIAGALARRSCKRVRREVFDFIPKPGNRINIRRAVVFAIKLYFFFKNKSRSGLKILVFAVLLFALVPAHAFAFDWRHVEFYTYGGFDAVDSAFRFIALIFSDKSYQGLFYTIMVLSLFFAGASSYLRFLQGRQEGNILSWAGPVLIAFVLFVAFVVPKGEVTIYDKVLNKQDTISNIPIGITTAAGLTSEIGDGILNIIDTTSINPDTDYENSAGGIGVLTIYNAVTHSLSIDSDFDRSMRRYIEDCYFFCLEEGKCDLANLENSDTLLSDQLGNAAFSSVYTVYYDAANPNGKTLTCQDDWNNYLRGTLQNQTSYQADAKKICAEAGVDVNNPTALQHCEDVTESYLQELYNGQYPDVTDSIYTYLEQDYIAQQVYKAAIASNSTLLTNYEVTTGGINIGMAFNTWIPTIRGVIIAFGLSLLPFLILFLPTPFFKKILGASIAVFLFQISWLIVDAVIHFFLVHEAQTLFSSVYIAHNVGYASFLVMEAPLAKSLAIWGYLRSLGMGLALIPVTAVTRFGAYGLQRMAAGLESAVEVGAVEGKEAMDVMEQGRLENEISSSIASRAVNAGMTGIEMRRALMNLKAKSLGAGSAYKSETSAYTTSREAESKFAGETNAEARVARSNNETMRDFGEHLGRFNAEKMYMAWKKAGNGNINNGVDVLANTEGATWGGSDRGKYDAVNGNMGELASVYTKASAAEISKEQEQFKEWAKLHHVRDDVKSAIEFGIAQGLYTGAQLKGLEQYEQTISGNEIAQTEYAELLNMWGKNKELRKAAQLLGLSLKDMVLYKHSIGQVVLNAQTAARLTELTGHKFTAGEKVTWAFDPKTGKVAWAVGDKGFATTDQNVYRYLSGISQQQFTGDADINVHRGMDGTIVSGTITGDIGKGLEEAGYRNLPRGLLTALQGVQGTATISKGQVAIQGTVSGANAYMLGELLDQYGDKKAGEFLKSVGEAGGTARIDNMVIDENGVPVAEVGQTDQYSAISAGRINNQTSINTGISVDVGSVANDVEFALASGNTTAFANDLQKLTPEAVSNANVKGKFTSAYTQGILDVVKKSLGIDRNAQYNFGLITTVMPGGLPAEVVEKIAGVDVKGQGDITKGKVVRGSVVIDTLKTQIESFANKTLSNPNMTVQEKEQALVDYVNQIRERINEVKAKGLNNVVNSSSNTISPQDVANATATQRWIEGQVNKGLFNGGTPSVGNPNLAPGNNYAKEFPTIANNLNKDSLTFTTDQIDRIIQGSGVGINVNNNPPRGERLNIADFKNLGNDGKNNALDQIIRNSEQLKFAKNTEMPNQGREGDDLTPPQSR